MYDTLIKWNTSQKYKKKEETADRCGRTEGTHWTLACKKETRHREHIVWFHIYEVQKHM